MSATRPLLSVVVPTHDVEPWIDELLESVLAQGVDDIEIVVVDDASTDGTRDRVLEHVERDPRVVLVPAARRGGAHARNQGIAVARGRYLVFADGDDLVPREAYRSMLDSLERSGSDMVVGDHLKFGPSSTWSPTARWTDLADPMEGAAPAEIPWVITGRACWNKMFRRAFWDAHDIEFPEVPRSNDIVPMTRAFLAASTVDVVPRCVYLYRDRPGATSMTARATADTAARSYFGQESICADLVRGAGSPEIARVYSRLVFDADTWVHLSRYLTQLGPGHEASDEVMEAARAVIEIAPVDSVNEAAADKRALALLVAAGEIESARRFGEQMDGARRRRAHDIESLGAWVEALEVIDRHPDTLPAVDRVALATDGLAIALANDADHVQVDTPDALSRLIGRLSGPSAGDTSAGAGRLLALSVTTSAVLRATIAAARRGDAVAVARASAGRRLAPLVVDRIDATRHSLDVSGPVADASPLVDAHLTAVPRGTGSPVPLGSITVAPSTHAATPGRWSARVDASSLPVSGRYSVEVRVAVADALTLDLPVVTTRLSIPPLGVWHALQGLSDRGRGRAFVVDRRSALAKRLARRAVTLVRRPGRPR